MKKEVRLDLGRYKIKDSYLNVTRNGSIQLILVAPVKVNGEEYTVEIEPLITIYHSGDYMNVVEEDAVQGTERGDASKGNLNK